MTKYEKCSEDPMDKFTKTGNKKKVGCGRIECLDVICCGSLREMRLGQARVITRRIPKTQWPGN
jgi:hypothetical protein